MDKVAFLILINCDLCNNLEKALNFIVVLLTSICSTLDEVSRSLFRNGNKDNDNRLEKQRILFLFNSCLSVALSWGDEVINVAGRL